MTPLPSSGPADPALLPPHAPLPRHDWDTMEACIPPEQVVQALRDAGFSDVRRHAELGVFSEYTAIETA